MSAVESSGESAASGATLEETLDSEPSLEAVACVDLGAGVLLGLYAREEDSRASAELAATNAAEICGTSPGMPDEEGIHWALVASESAVHVYARSEKCPDRVVVGVARPDANVALVLASLRSVAETLGAGPGG